MWGAHGVAPSCCLCLALWDPWVVETGLWFVAKLWGFYLFCCCSFCGMKTRGVQVSPGCNAVEFGNLASPVGATGS